MPKKDEIELIKKFKGRLEGCPDRGGGEFWLDSKIDETIDWEYTVAKLPPIPKIWIKNPKIYNMTYNMSNLFKEFIWDIARGFGEMNIFVFREKGAYIRHFGKRWEAWCEFVNLHTDEEDEMGGSYDLISAFPKALSKMRFAEEKVSEGEGVFLGELPAGYWSAERMAPFEIRLDPERSRIRNQQFFPGNGVGFSSEVRPPKKGDLGYWKRMGDYEIRKKLELIKPGDLISIEKIRKQLQKEEARRGGRRVQKSKGNKIRIFGKEEHKEGLLVKKKRPFEKLRGKKSFEIEKQSKRKKKNNDLLDDDISSGELDPSEEDELTEEEDTETEREDKQKKSNRNRLSQLEELGFNEGGIPMPESMRRNLVMTEVVEESYKETELGMLHSLSSVRYNPSKSEFKVRSTGKHLRQLLGKDKTFDPMAFSMTKQAQDSEDAREKTLSVDFVVARPIPRLQGEKKLLPAVSEMLAKAYNKFLFIGRCMEVGDERGVWTMIRDGVFSTANNLTRVHDARMTSLTGSTLYTSRVNMGEGLVRQKVRNRLKKERGKDDIFFRIGGGYGDPPQQTSSTINPNFIPSGLLPSTLDSDDLLDDDPVGNTNTWHMANTSRLWGITSSNRIPERNRFGTMARGTDRSSAVGYTFKGGFRGQRARRGMSGRGTVMSGRNKGGKVSSTGTTDNTNLSQSNWESEESSTGNAPSWG
jgi:hypothetical protein